MILESNTTLIMAGDSITDCERDARSANWDDRLGKGYVKLFAGRLFAKHPGCGIRILNAGIAGNTTRDLKNRWQTDVLDQNPDYVSIMVGINDLSRAFKMPDKPEEHINIDEYRENLTDLTRWTQPHVKKILLISPFFLEQDRAQPRRQQTDRFRQAMQALAEEYGCLYLDVQREFDNLLENQPSTWLAADQLHPNVIGHTLLSEAILRSWEV